MGWGEPCDFTESELTTDAPAQSQHSSVPDLVENPQSYLTFQFQLAKSEFVSFTSFAFCLVR